MIHEDEEYTIEDALASLDALGNEWGVPAPAIETARCIVNAHSETPVEVGQHGPHGAYVEYPRCFVAIAADGRVASIEVYAPTFKQTCWLLDRVKEAQELWPE